MQSRSRSKCYSATFGTTVLSYAVLSGEYGLSDTTETVIAPLAMGANPEGVPKDMWENYVQTPTRDMPADAGKKDTKYEWCTPELRETL